MGALAAGGYQALSRAARSNSANTDATSEGNEVRREGRWEVGFKKGTRLGGEVLVQQGLAGLIEDVQVHASGVKVHAAIESVPLFIGSLLVEAHHGFLAMGVGA